MSRRAALWLRWGALAAYSAVIFYLSSRSDIEPPSGLSFEGLDKIVHACLYAVWGCICAWALSATRPGLRRPALITLACLAGTAYGASDEIHQRFVPGRESSLFDLAADCVGSFLGAAGYVWVLPALLRARSTTASREP